MMRTNKLILAVAITSAIISSCKNTKLPVADIREEIISNPNGEGPALKIDFTRGKEHNHPLMAIWVADMDGKYIQTLYVAESIGKGIFQHGDATSGQWLPAEIRRPAALPVWSHSRGITESDGLFIPTPENAIADAYTGATPQFSFTLNTKMDKKNPPLSMFNILFEINQTWDWNEYWTNNKFPDDPVYKTSCQPSLIYSATIDLNDNVNEYEMKLIGRGHHSGQTGEIYTDLETMTTALDITDKITVQVLN